MIQQELENLGLCDICRPIVSAHYKDRLGEISLKEKGIDMMIAIEMIRHGILLKDCSRIILLSGDADFIPCMDLLKQHVGVMSACTAKGYSYELRAKHHWHILNKEDICA
ncbi:MAG: NYN domain-containing protein [Candidatus Paceibacterota bacterium]